MLFFLGQRTKKLKKRREGVSRFWFGWLEAEESFLPLNGRKRPSYRGVDARRAPRAESAADDGAVPADSDARNQKSSGF